MRALLDAHSPPVFGQSCHPCPPRSVPELYAASPGASGGPGCAGRGSPVPSPTLAPGTVVPLPLGTLRRAPGAASVGLGAPRGRAGVLATGTPVPGRFVRCRVPVALAWLCPACCGLVTCTGMRPAHAGCKRSGTLCINAPKIKSPIAVSLMFFLNLAN